MLHYVFVYGTLMQDEGNHRLLRTSKFVQPDHAFGFTLLHMGGFPAVVPCADSAREVTGEVFQVADAALARLDCLEGVPTLYTRETVTLGSGIEAFIYVLTHRSAKLPVIESGDWRKRGDDQDHWVHAR